MARRVNSERWRQIPGYEDYDVSSNGRIRSWKTGKSKLMRTRIGSDGYVRVTLQDSNGIKRVKRVHVLVARAFLGHARGRLVRHRDRRTSNPRLSNLEYGTHLDNSRDKHRHGTDQVGERNSQAELTAKHVKQIYSLKGELTQDEIARMFGVSRQAVSDIHRRITWTHVTRKL